MPYVAFHSSYSANSTNNVAPPSFRIIEQGLPPTSSFAQWRYPENFTTGDLFVRLLFVPYGRITGASPNPAPTPPGVTDAFLYRNAVQVDTQQINITTAGPGEAPTGGATLFELEDTSGLWVPGDAISLSVDVSAGNSNENTMRIVIADSADFD